MQRGRLLTQLILKDGDGPDLIYRLMAGDFISFTPEKIGIARVEQAIALAEIR